ncbi:MAG: T9SS type A sorting domain-containing protein [Muribaculaceae bacterium]|nr:T9SS type A sorting domain-containing protein [Muribaculaceae bacterium]
MKHFSTHALLLLLSLTWLAPKANAATYFSYSGDAWDHYYTYGTTTYANNSAFWFQGAVANGKIYTLPAVASQTAYDKAEDGTSLSYMISGTYTRGLSFDFQQSGADWFSCGSGSQSGYPVDAYVEGKTNYYYAGPAIAADNAETLWFPTRCSTTGPQASQASNVWAQGIKAVAYYTKDNLPIANTITTRKGINLSTYNIGRSDLMSAYGDGANGEGYLWFCDETNNKVVRVKIVEGQAAGEIEFTPPCTIVNRSLVVQYADNRVIYSSGRDGNKKIYRGVINGNSITWYDLGVTTVGNTTTYGSPGATMFIMGGYEYLAYSSSTAQVTINVYDGTNPANTNTLETFSLIPFGSNYLSSSSYMNHSINAVVANDKMSAVLYFYVPSKGAFKRKLTALKTKAQDPVQNLAVEIVKDQDPTQLSRQDAVLSWDAPANGEVSKYTIYSRENPWFSMEPSTANSQVPQGLQHTWSAWEAIGTTTEQTFTDINVSKYSPETSRSYQYKVVPTFTSGTIGAESEILEITPELVPFVPVWDTTMDQDDKKFGIDRYDGYCKIQLYWKFPQVNNYNQFPANHKEVYGVKPDYYSILRNGEEIVPYITCYNYIDTDVKSEQTYTYHVVSHYDSYPELTAISAPNVVYVEKRDWAKVGYELTEIYNYKIAESGDSVHIPASSYSNMGSYAYAYYKQAAYHDGYWYVAQNTNAGETNGGIIKISAAAPWENKTENVLTPGTVFYNHSTHYSTNPAYRNMGIATDFEGNLFIQSGSLNFSGTSTTYPYYNRIAEGKVFIKNSNGSFTTYTVDLSGIDLTEYNEYDKAKFFTTAPGRCDYYTMGGNLKTKGEAYLYLAPSVSRAVFVIKLTYNGSKVTASLVNKYQNTESISRWTNERYLQANENLCIPINCSGRENEFIHLIRSSGMSLMEINPSSTFATNKGTVYDTQSRVNTPGGCTFEFNGELFIVTPTSQYSVNKGNFYVGIAERKDGDTPETANLSHIIPIAIVQQDDAENGGGSSSGTVSIFAEVGEKDINGDGKFNDYVYIYLYSPSGQRFAKYRLTPSSAFPPSQVTLDIKPVYAEEYDPSSHNPGGNIERFDATATWTEVTDYGTTEGGNLFYSIEGYTLNLVDKDGNIITEYPTITFEVPRDVNKDGNVDNPSTAITFNNDGTTSVEGLSWTKNDAGIITYIYVYKNVDKNKNYTANVTVNYVGVDESNIGTSQKSPTTEYEHSNTYQPKEATGSVLVDIKKNNWSDWDADYQGNPSTGAKDPDDAYYDSYRVCLLLSNPDFGSNNEYPRSYYTIGIDKDKNGTIDQYINEFKLFAGEQSKAKAAQIVDSDGYIAITDGQIPGDYNFDIETGGKPHIYWDMLDYTAPAYYNDGVTYTENDNPSTWNYIVTTTYAAGNAKIREVVTSPMVADNGGITTGVEVISTQSVLNVYPIPATISVTIKCSEAVEGIEIYSESGMLVKKMTGNGEQMITVNVSDLASGYYFMRVNNLSPVRIIKN